MADAAHAPPGAGSPEDRRRQEQRIASMRAERASWVSHWRELSENEQPRLGRFLANDVNRGSKRHNTIYDRTILGAVRTLSGGMMSGTTSPARPWFRLRLRDRDLMAYAPVKLWLSQVAELLRDVFAMSNTYETLQKAYGELGVFGTWANVVQSNFDTVIRHHAMTVGEYMLGCNGEQKVDTLAREYQMTAGQLAGTFGLDKCSAAVKSAVQRSNLDAWFPVCHLIEPNAHRDPTKMDARGMGWTSVYFEPSSKEHLYLRRSGYKRFRALTPRWDVTGNDIYGHSPGMEALGDTKQLQHAQLRKSQGIEYMVNPPIQVPVMYKDAAQNRLPGGVMFVDTTATGGGVRSAFDVTLNLQHLLADIADVRQRIREAFYADLFLMLANDTRSGVTATEIAERHEEKLLMLGPVLERLHGEMLTPMIDIAFDQCVAADILPPPPAELAGSELNIEFISTLAQAQRIVAAQGTDRLLGTIGSMAQMWPEVRAKVRPLAVVDMYAEAYGVSPAIIADDDEARELLARQAQAAAVQQIAASVPAAASAASTVSGIDTENLGNVLGMFQGYGSPTP